MGVPKDYAFHDPLKRAEFLSRPWFWKFLMPAEHVLSLQRRPHALLKIPVLTR
jgi:hypothetical protein